MRHASADAITFVVFTSDGHAGECLLALATDGDDLHLALPPSTDLDHAKELTIRVARAFERARRESEGNAPDAYWVGHAIFEAWPDVEVATHIEASLPEAAASADRVAAGSPTLFDHRCRYPDAFPRLLPGWEISFHASNPYAAATGHRMAGPWARLWVHRSSSGYVGSVATIYTWWDPDQDREYPSAEGAAKAATGRFELSFGKPAHNQTDQSSPAQVSATGALRRSRDGVHVLDVTLFGGLRQLLEVRPDGHASWAAGLHLNDLQDLKALETGTADVRLDDPLWDVLGRARKAAHDFGNPDTAGYIADVIALAVLDYPAIAGEAQDAAPSLPLPTLREALTAMTWPGGPQPLEALPVHYLRLLRRWLDPEQMPHDAYAGPGALELAEALDAFFAERPGTD
jgi:hypothetical protein